MDSYHRKLVRRMKGIYGKMVPFDTELYKGLMMFQTKEGDYIKPEIGIVAHKETICDNLEHTEACDKIHIGSHPNTCKRLFFGDFLGKEDKEGVSKTRDEQFFPNLRFAKHTIDEIILKVSLEC